MGVGLGDLSRLDLPLLVADLLLDSATGAGGYRSSGGNNKLLDLLLLPLVASTRARS